MGTIRRIKKQMSQPIAMADTKIAFNNCKVFLGHPNPAVARKASENFAGFMQHVVSRANRVNMRDLYEAHFQILSKIESGEELIEKVEDNKKETRKK